MIRYQYKNAKLLFVGINPHYGSFDRGVPFSNNKTLWYLFSRSGLIKEKEEDLRDDKKLKKIYKDKFNKVYRLGLINIINRATRDVSELKKDEEIAGRRYIDQAIKQSKPNLVCFIGKVTYQKFSGIKDVSFGWQKDIYNSKSFVMHFPLRGEASIRIDELKLVGKESGILE
jgi:TDG/mug DNA glycosylase family protein